MGRGQYDSKTSILKTAKIELRHGLTEGVTVKRTGKGPSRSGFVEFLRQTFGEVISNDDLLPRPFGNKR